MSIEAMKLALEYLESEVPFYECEGNAPPAGLIETITTLRAAIEQAEKQEPAAWFVYIPSQQCGEYFDSEDDCELVDWMTNYPDAELTKLYTAPPQREWVGLTDGDVNYCVDAIYKGFDIKPINEIEIKYFERVIKFVEAKLKEKNT